jgi:DNA-binding CsgD family transcriptional regulator
MKKNETLEKITQKTADPEVRKLVKNEYATDKTYADFNKTFGEIHPGFFEALKRKAAPERLTRLELRYCTYIYLQKSNKEIAGDLNVHYGTVKSHKNSLKKKLKIDRNTDFEDFIQTVYAGLITS